MSSADKKILPASKIKDMIKEVLNGKSAYNERLMEKDVDQLAEEISVYHQELEYQNNELLRIQYELEKVNDHYVNLFQEAPVGYVIYREDGKIIRANRQFSKIFTYTENTIGQKIESFICADDQDALYLHLKKVISKKEKDSVVVRSFGDNRLFLRIESNIMPGEAEIIIRSAVIDITTERMYEERLRQAKEEAEAANLAKSNFLRNVSHDLRTPIGAIRGFAELIEMADPEEDISENIEIIKLSCNNMLNMVNNLIELAKIESGKMEHRAERFDLRETINKTVKIFSEKAISKGIDLRVTISDELPDSVIGDFFNFQNLLINIVGNAIKFTEEGFVSVEAMPSISDRDCCCVRFVINDSGIGVATSDQAALFEPFKKLHGREHDFEGSGLGLMISKKIVELMHGSIHVESDIGQGTTVVFAVCFDNIT